MKAETRDMTPLKHMLVQPRHISMMCGVSWFEWAQDKATAVYTSGERETCEMDMTDFFNRGNNAFSLVGEIQARCRQVKG
jgi:hypothetical protein